MVFNLAQGLNLVTTYYLLDIETCFVGDCQSTQTLKLTSMSLLLLALSICTSCNCLAYFHLTLFQPQVISDVLVSVVCCAIFFRY